MLTATPWGPASESLGPPSRAWLSSPVAIDAPSPPTSRRRRRRTPEVAEQEIIAAAEALLRERPFRELTVDEVMRRTDLSRPSFYVYFRDRHHLVLRVVEHIGGELFTMSDRWYPGEGDGRALVRDGDRRHRRGVRRARAGAARAGRRGGRRSRRRARLPPPRAELHRRDGAAHPARDGGRPRARARARRDGDGARVDDGALPDARPRPRAAPRAQRARETLETIWARVLYGAG